jgi:pimeloyl-ACP methyl ester carboxylesterase
MKLLRSIPKLVVILGLLVTPILSKSQSVQIDEKGFVQINGIEQWITIKGDRSKPVILFLHGGPGSPLTPYADAMFSGWEKDFVLVQWDQRGAGKTYGRTAPAELTPVFIKSNPLKVEEMIKDGIKVAEYLVKHLGKQKIILFGSSWGSVLGIQLAEARPDLFYAYIGHSQLLYPANDLKLAWQKAYQQVKKAADQKSLAVLDALGMPPYDTARQYGQFFRVLKKYEQLNSTPAPEHWMKISAEYDNEKDNQHRYDGDDYSFVYFEGDKKLGIEPMSRPVSGLNFKIPIYILQGATDIMTPAEISRPYFDQVTAPKKEFVLLPTAAHGFNEEVVKNIFQICKKLPIGVNQ